ncbi:unnamed protein product [Closterium sp. Naga37s-1]|nr:unnamed protein product [Closterium sp. Naga37s-1]
MASTRVLLVSLLIVLVSAQFASGQIRRNACLPKDKCPDRKSKLCGLYATCKTLVSIIPDAINCDDCAAYDLKKMPASTCNFTTGRCLANKIAGKACTAKLFNTVCDKKEPAFTCLKVENVPVTKKSPQAYRCCRRTCPVGLCGRGMKPLSWKNECNVVLDCPTACAPRAANAVAIWYL